MGRPLKKSFFGNPDGTGKQLVLSYVWLTGSVAAETGYYVVRQVGTSRYQVTNGTKTGVVKLVDALPDAPGEGVIIIKPFGLSQVEYAKKIHNRTVVTFDDNTYMWSKEAANANGEADLPFEIYIPENDKATDLAAIVNAADATAIVTLLNTTPEVYMDSSVATAFAGIATGGGGRQAAVGDGFIQFATIFGAPTTLAQAQEIIAKQVAIETLKYNLIASVDSATSATALLTALKNNVPAVSADRQALIRELQASDVQAANDLAATLAAEDYTILFAKLAEDIAAGANLKEFSKSVYAARQAESSHKFFGTTKMLVAINSAYEA